MVSILDRDNPLPIIIKPDFTSELVLVAVSLILILVFWCWVLYTLYTNSPAPKVYFQCLPGKCATNVYNGEKRCPSNAETSAIYDPGYEVCNSKFTCESEHTPYALLSDGSTNELGVCEDQNICRCLTKPRCSPDNLVVFSMTGGNVLQDGNTSRAVFVQHPISFQGSAGSEVLSFDDTNIQFCSIKAYHANRISPGACSFRNSDDIKLREIRDCLQRNPCVIGVLAFSPLDASQFVLNSKNTDAIYSVPVACVPSISSEDTNFKDPSTGPIGNFCTGKKIPVWNRARGKVECYDIGDD